MIFGKLDEEERAILEEKLIKVYFEKGITFDDDTLYIENNNKLVLSFYVKCKSYNVIIKDDCL